MILETNITFCLNALYKNSTWGKKSVSVGMCPKLFVMPYIKENNFLIISVGMDDMTAVQK